MTRKFLPIGIAFFVGTLSAIAESGRWHQFDAFKMSTWFGWFVPAALLLLNARIPHGQRLPSMLFATGMLLGMLGRTFGVKSISVIGLLLFSTSGLLAAVLKRDQFGGDAERPLGRAALAVLFAMAATLALAYAVGW